MEGKDALHLARMMWMLGPLDGWLARIDPDAARQRPMPGSALSADDEYLYPYRLSDAAWHALSHAVDHLSCLRAVVRDAGLIHMYAPFSLLRAALENASAAVWMLQPTVSQDRLTRRLRLAADDIRNDEKVRQLTGRAAVRPKWERLNEVREIAGRASLDERLVLSGTNYSEIVGAVRADGLPDDHIKAIWRLCSGFAHGDLWTLNATVKTALPSAVPGVGSFKIEADTGLLAHVIQIAVGMTGKGWQLHDRLSMAGRRLAQQR
jgi:hypothetical protein